jgi:hypothetical protein
VPASSLTTSTRTSRHFGGALAWPVTFQGRWLAANGQQPGSVTTGEPARKPWRIMTADPAIDGH